MEEREDSEFLLDRAYRHPSGNIHQAGRYMSLELRDVWAGGVTSGQQRTEAMSVHEITGDSGAGAAAPGPGLEEGTRREARPGGDRNRGASQQHLQVALLRWTQTCLSQDGGNRADSP